MSTKSLAITAGVLAGIVGGMLFGLIVLSAGAQAPAASPSTSIVAAILPPAHQSGVAGTASGGSSSTSAGTKSSGGSKSPGSGGTKSGGSNNTSPGPDPAGSVFHNLGGLLNLGNKQGQLTEINPGLIAKVFKPAPKLEAPLLLSPASYSLFAEYADSVYLEWKAVPGAVVYEVELAHYQPGNPGGFDRIETKHASSFGDAKVSLLVDLDYMTWRVRAVDQYGNTGPWSDRWQIDQKGKS
jgi:hypothetical protein